LVIAFDPLIAATAYLQQIPPHVRDLAVVMTDAHERGTALGWFADGVLILIILKSRVIQRIANGMRPRTSGEWLVQAACALAFGVLFEGARAAVQAVGSVLWPAGGGGTRAMLGVWPVHAMLDAAGFWIISASANRAPKWWWVWLSGVCALIIAAALVIWPAFAPQLSRGDRAVLAPQGAPILAFAQRGGLKAQTLYAFDGADPADVDAEGFAGGSHLAVSRAALVDPQPETYAALGHLLGHYRHKDLWRLSMLVAAAAALQFWIMAKGAGPLARKLGEPSLRGAADPAGVAALALIGWACAIGGSLAFNGLDRSINYGADAYAMSLTHNPDALARWLITSEAKSKADPGPIETVLFYDHPPLRSRLIAAMRWKAAHGGP
jgi:STE24 endopeptidase